MSAVSIGYFDPSLFHPNVDRLTTNIGERLIDEARSGVEPRLSRDIVVDGRATGATYIMSDRQLPMSIDEEGWADGSFYFVLRAQGRPALLTVSDNGSGAQAVGADVMHSRAKIGQPFGLGAIELAVGTAVHFQRATTWQGIVGLPLAIGRDDVQAKPTVMMVRIDGFDAANIETAVHTAAAAVQADKGWWHNRHGLIGL